MVDNDSPFSNEFYFDGSRVRTIPSGKELNEVILEKIGVSRTDCWITDLVKVFLFKEGHIKRYEKLGKTNLTENRNNFIEYAEKSLVWLDREIELCNPKIIILLGLEVTKVFFSLSDSLSKEYLNGSTKNKTINGIDRNIICLPHPGILMKKTDKNPWPERFDKEISLTAKDEIEMIKKAWR
jgi:uracil-DNA glycosylase